MTPINFTARFLADTSVSRIVTRDKTVPEQAAIVELDRNDKNDMEALYELSDIWNKRGTSYAYSIYCDAIKGYDYDDVVKEHYIALTTQKDNFDTLDSNKVLGLTLFSETNTPDNEINWLQVDPENNNSSKIDRNYKMVGSAIINYIKSAYPEKPVYVQSVENALDFYKKNGFDIRSENKPNSLYLEC